MDGTQRFDPSLHDAWAKALRDLSAELAKASVDAQYAQDPRLLEAFGERGYRKSIEDALHTIAVLSEAVALGDEGIFRRYASWLKGILEKAGLPSEALPRHFALLLESLVSKLPADQARLPAEYLGKALRELGEIA